ncbi:hypothetical protein M422DRAFT_241314 [Sphaerobolus stellatus SS14]|nr:hypothetical protein M422DRAFT_241314 [Sphaerobolus stellatus SS14]
MLLAYDHGTPLELFNVSILATSECNVLSALTFDEEMRHLWSSQPTLVSLLTLFVRYFTLVTRLADILRRHRFSLNCAVFRDMQFVAFCTIITIVVTHVIMAYRVYALYRGRTVILFLLATGIVLESILMAVKMYTGFGTKIQYTSVTDAQVVNCLWGPVFPQFESRIAAIFWGFPLIVDTLIFVLKLIQCRKYVVENFIYTKPPYLKIILLNGLLYYIVLGILHALNLSLILMAPVTVKTIATGLTQSLSSIIVSRLVFNLRNTNLEYTETESAATDLIDPYFTTVLELYNAYDSLDIPLHQSGKSLP